MAKIVAGRGQNRVEISPELEEAVNNLFEAAYPVSKQEMERSLSWLLWNARRQWPVRTGLSKAALGKAIAVGLKGEGLSITGSFFNDVFYARFVRTAESKKKKPTAKQLEWEKKQKLSGKEKQTRSAYKGGRHAMTEMMRKPFEKVEAEFENIIVQEILKRI